LLEEPAIDEPHIKQEELAAVLREAAKLQSARRRKGPIVAVVVGVLVAAGFGARSLMTPPKPLDPVAAAIQAESYRQQALRQRYEKNFGAASSLAAQAVALVPTNVLALTEQALCYEYAGSNDKAQAGYLAAIAAGPTSRDACYPEYNLACMLAKTPRKAEAEQHFKAAIARWPDFAPAHSALGALQEQQGRTADALASYAATIKADAVYRAGARNKAAKAARLARAARQLDRAKDLLAKGQPRQALDLAHLAINMFGNNRLARRELGLDYDGDPKAAHKLADGFFEEGTKLHKEAHRHHDDQAGFREAVEHAMSAVEIDPDDFPACELLAMLYRDLGRHDEAINAFQLALEMGPPAHRVGFCWHLMGDDYAALGRNDEAIDAYRQAIAVNPGFYYPYERLAKLYQRLGKLPEAQAVLSQGLVKTKQDEHLKHMR
jgi:tetratricopeptide (TPR) repeat protein